MKTHSLMGLIAIMAFIFFGCQKESSDTPVATGTLVLKGSAAFDQKQSIATTQNGNAKSGSSLISMHTTNLKVQLAEVWVSQSEVKEGISDNFAWVKVGESDALKLVEEYYFSAQNLTAGDYKSIKMAFKNRIVRVAVYHSDLNQVVEMAGSLDESSCGDDSVITQYFSANGSFMLSGGSFSLMSPGENISGFSIRSNETTTISWKLGGPDVQITDCSFVWNDVNENGVYDCGIDATGSFDCIVDTPMWSFSVQ
jgi:hypothetical protein